MMARSSALTEGRATYLAGAAPLWEPFQRRMCTLAIYSRVGARVPLLVAANRDEFLNRPTAPPGLLSTDPWVVGGRDLVAGGTWLGLNQHGVVVGLLNRRSPSGPDPSRKSRGILTLRVLQCGGLADVEAVLGAEQGGDYNPFTLLAANRERALVATSQGGDIRVRELAPGLHVLTNLEVDDPACPRIAASYQRFAAVDVDDPDLGQSRLEKLRGVMANHSTAPTSIDADDGLCVHRGPYGTRSSTVIALATEGSPDDAARYWHADGPPCRAGYAAVELPRSSQ